MKRLFLGLHARLILVVVIAIFPAIFLTFYNASNDRKRETAEAQSEALRLAQVIAQQEDELIATTRQLLVAISYSSDVRSGDPKLCNEFLAHILQNHFKRYDNLGAIRLNGDIFSSAAPLNGAVNVSDRSYFQRVIQTRDFAMGEYQIGRITGKQSVVFANPVMNDNGQVQGAVFAALDLRQFNKLEYAVESELPLNSTLTKIDRNGLVLVHYPDTEKWIGRPYPNTSLVKIILKRHQGVIDAIGQDSLPRVNAFAPVRGAVNEQGMHVILDIPQSTVYAGVDSLLARNMSVIGIFAVLALAAAWFGGDILILRRTRVLVSATERLAAGDLSARAGPPYENSELSHLALAFDQMANSLAEREVERKLGEEKLQASEAELRALIASMTDVILVLDIQGRYLEIPPTNSALLYKPSVELIGKTLRDVFPPEQSDTFLGYIRLALETQQTISMEYCLQIGDMPIWFTAAISRMRDDSVIWVARDITQRKQTEQALEANKVRLELLYADVRQHVREIETLSQIGQKLSATLDENQVIELLGNEAGNLLRPGNLGVFLCDKAQGEVEEKFYLDRGARKAGLRFPLGEGLTSQIIIKNESILTLDYVGECEKRHIRPRGTPAKGWMGVPIASGGSVLGALAVWDYEHGGSFSEQELRVLSTLAAQAAIAIKNARLYEETQFRLAELETVNKVSSALRAAQTFDDMLPLLLDETLAVLGSNAGSLWLYDSADKVLRQTVNRGLPDVPLPIKPGEGLTGQVFLTGQPYVSRAFRTYPQGNQSIQLEVAAGLGGVVMPIRTSDHVVGVLNVAVELPREVTIEEVHLLSTLAEMAGNAINRMQLHEQTLQYVQRLSALHAIDVAISSTRDNRVSLGVLLDQVMTQLRVDAADILLFNPHSQLLEYAAGRGFRYAGLGESCLRLGEGHAGRAALERQCVIIPNLREDPGAEARSRSAADEGFVTYYGVPLVVKGQIKGVLEAFHRHSQRTDSEWLGFLQSLGQQAAIAIDNAELFESLQHTNAELALAYDTTLEGWSSALDLRDKETEGHTQRVTELTVRFAQAMDIDEAELVHIRRGSLLHDIGKMGIPDSILLKPDRLTSEEWEIMRLHPTYAFKLLSPISYLRPALDIPYCHHEKWDGTGYPRGLKGEEIPLMARLFAIVDVWDALRSDRPYRAAWSEDKVSEHIQTLAGMHFDPNIVDAFLKLRTK